jgi:hypothetical protein
LIKDPLQGVPFALERLGSHGFAHWFWLPGAIQENLAEPPNLETEKKNGNQPEFECSLHQ